MLHESHSGSHAGAILPSGDICKYLETVLVVTAPRVASGGWRPGQPPHKESHTTFTVAGLGTECERVCISCLLLGNNCPLSDVAMFQPVIKALGLFRDC